MSDGPVEVVKTRLSDVIPAEVHGFSVKVGLGPYPPDRPRPGEQAVYAELLPVSQRARDACHYKGKKRILGMIPLTPEAALDLAADPSGPLAEKVARDALAVASRLAKQTA